MLVACRYNRLYVSQDSNAFTVDYIEILTLALKQAYLSIRQILPADEGLPPIPTPLSESHVERFLFIAASCLVSSYLLMIELYALYP